MEGERTPWFEAYAAVDGLTGEEAIARDRARWPGGHMAGFTTWLAGRREEFGVPMCSRPLTDAELVAFDDFVLASHSGSVDRPDSADR